MITILPCLLWNFDAAWLPSYKFQSVHDPMKQHFSTSFNEWKIKWKMVQVAAEPISILSPKKPRCNSNIKVRIFQAKLGKQLSTEARKGSKDFGFLLPIPPFIYIIFLSNETNFCILFFKSSQTDFLNNLPLWSIVNTPKLVRKAQASYKKWKLLSTFGKPLIMELWTNDWKSK